MCWIADLAQWRNADDHLAVGEHPAESPPSFVFGVNAPAQFGELPADLYPGVTSGGTDVLNVLMLCTSQVYTIAMRDGFGRTRLITMTSEH